MKDGIYNAFIKDARICINDEGYFTVVLDLSYGGGLSQSFGGFGLAGSGFDRSRKQDDWKFGYTITRIMEICEVDNFSNVKNTYVRVIINNENPVAIGNIIVDKWFNPTKEIWHDV